MVFLQNIPWFLIFLPKLLRGNERVLKHFRNCKQLSKRFRNIAVRSTNIIQR